MTDKKAKIFAAIILSTSVVLAITSVWNDSLIVDEIPHIGAGYSYLVKHDLRLNPEHPPLAKDLAAIPLLFLKLKQTAFQTKQWLSDINGQWEFGRKLIFNSGNNADLITDLAKLPMLLFFVLAAVLTFKWGKKLYGNSGALIALTLFSFSPTILAHARFVTTDVPALFGVLLATYFFINYLENRSIKNLWLASICFGLALLTKFSTFLLVPYFIILAIIHGRIKNTIRSLTSTFLIFIVGVLIVIWPVYFFNTYHYPPARQKADTTYLLGSYGRRSLADTVIWASDKPGLRALSSYGLGLLMVNQRAIGGNTTYFLGEVTTSSWKKYFPIVYFIKEPLAWWGLVILAIITAGKSAIHPLENSRATSRGSRVGRMADLHLWFRDHFSEFAMLLWLVIYWAVSIKSNLNIGVRHLLPTYPFAILLVSGQLSKLLKPFKSRSLAFVSGFLVFFLMTWYVMENLKTYPYYLPYFNQTVGGSAGGYKYVVDSNLDWGQDLKRFSQWVKENNISKIEFDYFGWADPFYYLGNSYEHLSSQKYKSAEDFRARNQTNGWMAVSASFLEGSEGPPERPNSPNYLWLQQIQPVTTIGHSIFVYQLKAPEGRN